MKKTPAGEGGGPDCHICSKSSGLHPVGINTTDKPPVLYRLSDLEYWVAWNSVTPPVPSLEVAKNVS